MRQGRPKVWRAFLIHAALLCLCVSDGVGPRLVPYYVSPVYSAETASGRTRPASAGASERTRTPPSVASGAVIPKTSKAGDAFKKLTFFAAPYISLIPAVPAQRKAADLSRPANTSVCLPLHFGRAPPRPA